MIVLSDMLVEHQQQAALKRTSPPVPAGAPAVPAGAPAVPKGAPAVPKGAPGTPVIMPTSAGLGLDFDSRLLNIELVGGRLVVEADPSFVILLLIILLLLK